MNGFDRSPDALDASAMETSTRHAGTTRTAGTPRRRRRLAAALATASTLAVLLGLAAAGAPQAQAITPLSVPATPPATTNASPPATNNGPRVSPQDEDPESSKGWQLVRDSAFAGRKVLPAPAGVVELEAPDRAEDAAIVPITLRARPDRDGNVVRTLYLVIDNNPSPLGARFTFGPAAATAEIETRVRVEQYTQMRVIAEMSDGTLYMTHRFIKASGGCSAPADKDMAQSMASLGRMKLRVEGALAPDQPAQAQLMVSHPNSSGLAMNQVTRLYEPAYFVRRIDVSWNGTPVLAAEVDFTISENPNLRFRFTPHQAAGVLSARTEDTQDRVFTSKLELAAPISP